MSLLSKLFGARPKPAAKTHPAEVYKDFTITPAPLADGPGFRLSALIEKDIAGVGKSHNLVRADTFNDEAAAATAAVAKAKRLIDDLGDKLFT